MGNGEWGMGNGEWGMGKGIVAALPATRRHQLHNVYLMRFRPVVKIGYLIIVREINTKVQLVVQD